jgi:hypothetical protein
MDPGGDKGTRQLSRRIAAIGVLSLHLLRQDVIGAIRNSECTSCLGFVTGFDRHRV